VYGKRQLQRQGQGRAALEWKKECCCASSVVLAARSPRNGGDGQAVDQKSEEITAVR